MQVQVEDVGPCKKLLKIEVPKEQVDEELEKTYEHLSDTVVVPGFRKGHVPRWLMQSRFGSQVNDDTKQTLMTKSYEEAVKEQKLQPVGTAEFDEEVTFEPGKPLSFGVTIETKPDFEIEGYTDLKLKKPSVEPTKAEIKEREEEIRRRYATLEEVKSGSPKKEDVVLCRVILREGDDVYRDLPNHQLVVGDHVLVGMTEDETTAFLKGAKVGQTLEKEITLPDDYPDEAKQGSTMTLALEVQEVRRPVLPEVTEAWVKEMGFDSLDEFHEEVRSVLVREKERDVESELRSQLREQLLKKADFELPKDIISTIADRNLIQRGMSLRYQGVPDEEIEKRLGDLKDASRQAAERSAKEYFILDKIADKERIFVTEAEVSARLEAIAARRGQPAERVRREMEQQGGLSELRDSMRHEKVEAFLMEKADIKERKPAGKKSAKSGK
jgi:trigger factor